MAITKPAFDALPLQKDGPRGNAWGLFGDKDELGMLNLLNEETTLAAAKEIKHGIRVATDWPLNSLKKPCFGRLPFKQEILHKQPRTVNDDILTLNTQSSSQWDGLRHYGYQEEKRYFNGRTQDDIHGTTELGIHVWADSGGMVGRGVLLDWQSWAEAQGRPTAPLETTVITARDLQAVAESQNVSFKPGDILLIHSGYVRALKSLREDQAEAYFADPPPTAIGVETSEATLRWIWETGFVAVAGDMMGFEAIPFRDRTYSLHEWLLAGWGLPIGELFDLERLAEECRKVGKWSFFFSSVPLRVPGGVASPPNGVAIL